VSRALLLLALFAGCELERTVGLTTDPDLVHSVDRALRFSGRDRIDLLLVIDDSGSMGPKQQQLRTQLPAIVNSLATANSQRSVRVGVITTDLGAPGISCGKDRGGKLQAVGAGAEVGCQGPLNTPWLSVTPAGANFPDGQGLATTLGCMTSVGDKGCGFEMPLEAARRQLTGMADSGEPFARDEALLVVLFITDEDDCSADSTSDLFTANPAYGPLSSFRCARYGVLCGGGLIADGPAVYDGTCRPAAASDGGKLIDVQTYVDLFTRVRAAGGIKDDPADVVVAALDAPPTPFLVQIATGSDVCGQGVATCSVVGHSCAAPSDSAFFGDPAVRLDAVIQGGGGLSRSICETPYDALSSDLLTRVEASASGNACLPGAIADVGAADCTVTVDDLPVARCTGIVGGERCWLIDPDPRCPQQTDPRDGSTQQLHMRIVAAPLDQVKASCRFLVGD
jgi:hypothetical protein